MAEDKKETKEYSMVEVPTQMGLAIKKPDGTNLSSDEAVVEILNKLEKIEQAVA